ncbi:hypothetical protein [Rubrivivax gelatinosus]|uniref:hypothetical protein n=1 Tax=Rubrivivax gelatinosus TaxID=28068 RepID=UPI0002DF0687|nr:hypothetical protein [Rubrivivax gelatinosus]MBG6082743.1 hypothetical protein [Rubrivivax gelatinosus]
MQRFPLAVVLATLAATAFAAPAADSPQARYERDRAACLNGSSSQERTACLREAGAALAEARKGKLGDASTPEDWRANALRRCQVQPPSERALCERLARGEGKQEGSVAEGAIVRELVTVVPGTPPAPPVPPAPPTPPAR